MATVPSVLAILICEQIIVDQSQKKTLVSLFEKLHVPGFPVAQRLGFFARITDTEGDYTFTVRIVHLEDTEELVGQMEFPQIHLTDRLAVVDVAINVPAVVFPKPGHYEFQVYANDQYIGRAKMEVVKLEG
ncbi:MAG: DUF6941 family protein [Bryobacteraceae bacterium]